MSFLRQLVTLDPAMHPERVHQRRFAGWTKPPGARSVVRGTRWGNPYRIGDVVPAGTEHRGFDVLVRDAEHATRLYLPWITSLVVQCPELLSPLTGLQLMCFCRLPEQGQPDFCHAAVLTALANRSNHDHS